MGPSFAFPTDDVRVLFGGVWVPMINLSWLGQFKVMMAYREKNVFAVVSYRWIDVDTIHIARTDEEGFTVLPEDWRLIRAAVPSARAIPLRDRLRLLEVSEVDLVMLTLMAVPVPSDVQCW